jgi:hypothetical protein
MASALASPASALPLKVDGLVKNFGTVKAVSRVSLELRTGECFNHFKYPIARLRIDTHRRLIHQHHARPVNDARRWVATQTSN